MSPDSYTETTTVGWFSRIKNSIKGILFGIILVLACICLLWWNEGRAVRTAKGLTEGAGAVISVTAEQVEAGNEGKLVHLSGPLSTSETLKDETFRVLAPQALKLRRKVEMYQWKENQSTKSEKKLGGKEERVTTYSYETGWFDKAIDSSSFKKSGGHQNPGAIPHPSKTYQVAEAKLKAFKLSESQINKLSNWETLAVPASIKNTMPWDLSQKIKIQGGGIYFGQDPNSPQVGDLKITYQVVKPGVVSLVATQTGDSFKAYQTQQGTTIEMVRSGEATAPEMFEAAQSSNRTLTWILRVAGFLFMVIGFTMIFRPFSVVADVVPFIGSITQMGFGLVSFLLGAIISLFVIGLAWLSARPLLGMGLLAGMVGLLVLFFLKFAKAKKAGPPQNPPSPVGAT